MKRLFALLLAVSLLLMPATALAGQTRSSDETSRVEPTEVVGDSLYIAGNTVEILGTVNGDVVAAADTVSVSGTINGNLWVLGQTVTISGQVTGDVRAAGDKVEITGKIGGDVLDLSQSLRVSPEASIGRDLWSCSSTLTMDGALGRNLKARSKQAAINGSVQGTANVRSSEPLALGPGARLAGPLRSVAPAEIRQDARATVTGPVDFVKQQPDQHQSYFDRLAGQWYWFLASVLLLIALLLFFRRGAMATAAYLTSKPWRTLWTGLIFLIVTPFLAAILLVLIVGIPLSLITLTIYAVTLYAAKTVAALAVGSLIIRRKSDSFWLALAAGALGLAIYYALVVLPHVGWVIGLVTTVMGSGAFVLILRDVYQANRKTFGS